MLTSEELRQQLAEAEERELRKALADANGSPTGAARLLGVSKPTIYRRMERYGIGLRRIVEDVPA